MNRFALLAAVLFAVTACGGATPSTSPSSSPGSSASGSPPGSPTPSDAAGGIPHPTGADEVVLRLDEGGGMMMVDWVAMQAPTFTLYGDGTVIFRNPMDPPPASPDGFIRNGKFKTAKLSEPQIQELLLFAINDGALGVARNKYEDNTVADAGTTTFTISVEGQTKSVEVYNLTEVAADGPDAIIRDAFAELAASLRDFEATAEVATSPWQPAAYRATLIDSPGAAPSPWPWTDISVDDFERPADPNDFGFPRRTLSLEQMAALGVPDPEGGVSGIYLEGSDGKVYSIAIRPLFPDEDR